MRMSGSTKLLFQAHRKFGPMEDTSIQAYCLVVFFCQSLHRKFVQMTFAARMCNPGWILDCLLMENAIGQVLHLKLDWHGLLTRAPEPKPRLGGGFLARVARVAAVSTRTVREGNVSASETVSPACRPPNFKSRSH